MIEQTYLGLLFAYTVGVLALLIINYKYINLLRSVKKPPNDFNDTEEPLTNLTNPNKATNTAQTFSEQTCEDNFNAHLGVVSMPMFKDVLRYVTSEPHERETVAILALSCDESTLSQCDKTNAEIIRILVLRLRDNLHQSDFIVRAGDHSLYILLSNIGSLRGIESIANRILNVCRATLKTEDATLVATPYMGISTTDYTRDLDSLIVNAERAMIHLKESNTTGFVFYNDDIDKSYASTDILISDLREAMRKKEFVLHYQPQVDIKRGTLVGAEALIRWNHPEKGLVFPDKFIAVAESSPFIEDLTLWVLEEACRQHESWGIENFKVSVNISAEQFNSIKLISKVKRILRRTGMSPQNLNLEITETVSILDREKTIQTLTDLKDIGVTISVDDFGVGNSSLSYIKDFPIDYIKLDRSFIQGLGAGGTGNTGDTGEVVLRSILSMASELSIKTVIEGVETKEQLTFLATTHCTEVQGYYLSKPLSPSILKQYANTKPYEDKLRGTSR